MQALQQKQNPAWPGIIVGVCLGRSSLGATQVTCNAVVRLAVDLRKVMLFDQVKGHTHLALVLECVLMIIIVITGGSQRCGSCGSFEWVVQLGSELWLAVADQGVCHAISGGKSLASGHHNATAHTPGPATL